MKACLVILILNFGLSFMASGQSQGSTGKTRFIQVSKLQDLNTLHLNFCDTFSIEINGLYPILQELPRSDTDHSIVKSLLFKDGFELIEGGWGNWPKGPRIIISTYKKGDCNCVVSKMYYDNAKMKDGYYDLRVSEKITCNSDNFVDE